MYTYKQIPLDSKNVFHKKPQKEVKVNISGQRIFSNLQLSNKERNHWL